MKNETFYTKAITKLAYKGTFEWKDVMAAIKDTKYQPKNWMVVRGILQNFIDSKIVKRDPSDLKIEKYITIIERG